MVNRFHLVIFTRYPCLGQAKTRMIPALGPEGALKLHQELTLHTIATARQLVRHFDCDVQVHFHGGDREQMAAWLGQDLTYHPQIKGDLGAKMHHSFQSTLRDRFDHTIIIGTDCPGLTAVDLKEAFQQLEHHNLILGPALDGGYYLIGLSQPQPLLFRDITWGTDQVWPQTLKKIKQLGLNLAKLKPLPDIDRPEDLIIWEQLKSPLTPMLGEPFV